MGTRADFYVGRGKDAEWIGSIAWDGHPDSIPRALRRSTDEAAFREKVSKFLDSRDDATRVSDGWPWPWKDSRTTDYAYAFDAGVVWASSFGDGWFKATHKEPEHGDVVTAFPDMAASARPVPGGARRSGIMLVGR